MAPVIGRLFNKYGPRAVITPGTILVAVGYLAYAQFGTDTALWMIVVTHIIMMLGIGAVLASVQTNTLQYYPDGIALTQTIQQVLGLLSWFRFYQPSKLVILQKFRTMQHKRLQQVLL
ncbi:hypothetical protein [Robertmurraya kyonggiensis]|uniref:hypothetical protein n=1 Tax=Robertmurraya kyonggiensis TaxID=1037680 RepID=UPI001FE5A958|nr:hypothetical protein [Robertmurraya kyonggiensis]